MKDQPEPPAEEIRRLQRCIGDLVSILALPAIWSGGDASQIVRTLVHAVLEMLPLDIVYFRRKNHAGEPPMELAWQAGSDGPAPGSQATCEAFRRLCADDPQAWPSHWRETIGDRDLVLVPFQLGLQGEVGVLVAGSARVDFPRQTERLLLSVAANQAAIALGEAGLRSQQNRLTLELDRRVALRTAELAAANEELKRAEALLAGEKRLLEMVARGHSMSGILDALCLLVEATAPGSRCSIVLLDPGGLHLAHGAAPTLPDGFIRSIVGRPVIAESGPCAMSACLNRQIVASDLTTETRWAAYQWCSMALSHGIRACWSTPICSTIGVVLGAFAIYYPEPRAPTPIDQRHIEQFTHIAGIAIESSQGAAALRGSEARKAAILDSALDCIMTIDHRGCITEFNPAAERTFGFRREEVLNKPLADVIIPPARREEHRRGFARFLATGEARVLGRRMEMTAIRADGTEFPVELAITRIPVDGPPSFTGYLRDITERRKAEETLRRSEAYLAEAQRLSLTGSFGWNGSRDEHYWSDETFRIFGYDPSTAVTLDLIRQRVHPLDRPLMEQAITQAAEGGNLDYECRLLMPGGTVKYLHVVGHRAQAPDGRLEYIGAVQDVTERHLSEEAIGRVRSELAHVARMTTLGALTASIAHEVNQPLSGIITNASTCLRMLAADPPNIDGARETARRTIRDGHRASDVIARLRSLFSHKEALAERVDLNEATREVLALSSRELLQNDVLVRLELAGNLPPVAGDRVQLQQVILNLLLNASEAMAGIADRARHLVIRTERDGDAGIRLSVRDAGVGLDPQRADKFFQAFYTTKPEGMGIGLSVSRSIIERHHGRIWAAPNDGPGATFSFSVPCALDGETSSAEPGIEAVSGTHAAQRVMRSV